MTEHQYKAAKRDIVKRIETAKKLGCTETIKHLEASLLKLQLKSLRLSDKRAKEFKLMRGQVI
jgi:hypothetical protein